MTLNDRKQNGIVFKVYDFAESEKKNRLCVLCASSAAGGESMSKD
jgi:hypothetical protein